MFLCLHLEKFKPAITSEINIVTLSCLGLAHKDLGRGLYMPAASWLVADEPYAGKADWTAAVAMLECHGTSSYSFSP